MEAKSDKQHDWLRQLAGDWTMEGDGDWTEEIRPIGDVWIMAEARGTNPDGTAGHTIMTLGYDPSKGRFVGAWIGSMMTNMWHYDGDLDADGRVLTLNCEGPRFDDSGETTSYRDIIELDEDGGRTFRAEVLNREGAWEPMMSVRYRRAQ